MTGPVEEETQPEAVEAATAATRLLVDSAVGAATVQPPEEAADATSGVPAWREEIVDMKSHLLKEREPRWCEAKADMDDIVKCMKAEMLMKADLHKIPDGKDKMAMNIEVTVTKARVTESEMHRKTRVTEMRASTGRKVKMFATLRLTLRARGELLSALPCVLARYVKGQVSEKHRPYECKRMKE